MRTGRYLCVAPARCLAARGTILRWHLPAFRMHTLYLKASRLLTPRFPSPHVEPTARRRTARALRAAFFTARRTAQHLSPLARTHLFAAHCAFSPAGAPLTHTALSFAHSTLLPALLVGMRAASWGGDIRLCARSRGARARAQTTGAPRAPLHHTRAALYCCLPSSCRLLAPLPSGSCLPPPQAGRAGGRRAGRKAEGRPTCHCPYAVATRRRKADRHCAYWRLPHRIWYLALPHALSAASAHSPSASRLICLCAGFAPALAGVCLPRCLAVGPIWLHTRCLLPDTTWCTYERAGRSHPHLTVPIATSRTRRCIFSPAASLLRRYATGLRIAHLGTIGRAHVTHAAHPTSAPHTSPASLTSFNTCPSTTSLHLPATATLRRRGRRFFAAADGWTGGHASSRSAPSLGTRDRLATRCAVTLPPLPPRHALLLAHARNLCTPPTAYATHGRNSGASTLSAARYLYARITHLPPTPLARMQYGDAALLPRAFAGYSHFRRAYHCSRLAPRAPDPPHLPARAASLSHSSASYTPPHVRAQRIHTTKAGAYGADMPRRHKTQKGGRRRLWRGRREGGQLHTCAPALPFLMPHLPLPFLHLSLDGLRVPYHLCLPSLPPLPTIIRLLPHAAPCMHTRTHARTAPHAHSWFVLMLRLPPTAPPYRAAPAPLRGPLRALAPPAHYRNRSCIRGYLLHRARHFLDTCP